MIKQRLQKLGILSALIALGVFGTSTAYAALTPQFNQTINAGSFSGDIVDGEFAPVGSPAVAMEAVPFSYDCQPATGTLGTADEQIYISNPNAVTSGWTVSIAANATTAVWDGVTDFDFNDPTTSGCADGTDADALAGQMTVDASGATLSYGLDEDTDIVTGLTKGSSTAFNEGTTNSVTILSADASSDDIGDWTLQGVSLSQKIPAEQAADDTYHIHMVVSIVSL